MMDVLAVETLGTEPIAVWRWPRATRAIVALWQRIVRRPVISTHVLVSLGRRESLATQLATAGTMACLICRRPLPLPAIPRGLYQRTTFGCGGCGAYFYLDQAVDPDVYEEIRRRLASRAS